MSKSASHPLNDVVQPPKPSEPKPVLATIVTKTLSFETMPLWHEYRTAAWAIEDTIRRVAPEARR